MTLDLARKPVALLGLLIQELNLMTKETEPCLVKGCKAIWRR